MEKYHGAMVALVTPFINGRLDEQGLVDLIEFQIENGTHAIVPCGTTGESATLSFDEHKRVIELTVQTVAGRVPVIAGTGANNTVEAIELTQSAKESGADDEGIGSNVRALGRGLEIDSPVHGDVIRVGQRVQPSQQADRQHKYQSGKLPPPWPGIRCLRRDYLIRRNGKTLSAASMPGPTGPGRCSSE